MTASVVMLTLMLSIVASQIMHEFVGRKQELEQWSNLLDDPSATGQAVVVVGKYGMGKTWLLDQMLKTAKTTKSLKICTARYALGPGESPGMILRIILDDIFQAARYKTGTLDPEGKRFEQWLRIYQTLGLFRNNSPKNFRLLEQLWFDNRKNIFDQFTNRLKLLSDAMPEQSRLLLAIDPEQETLASRVELWTQVVKNLPPKFIFLFAQRFQDSLAINEDFRSQANVHFIPSLEQQPQGLADLQNDETEQLLETYFPKFKDKSIDRETIQQRFLQYRNHPYAVHASLNLLLSPSFTDAKQLPEQPMPAVVCPLQWKGITEHPLHEDAIRLFKAYAALEIPVLDEMACWVADISSEKFHEILVDPFLGSMIRSDADGRLLYHHYLLAYIRSLLYDHEGNLTPEAEILHQRAMTGYSDLMNRTIKPDPLATSRLAEHALGVGGPMLFAETLCQCSESFMTLGFYQTYAALIDRALALIPPLSPEAAALYLHLGQLRHRQGDLEAAMKYYGDSLQTARKIVDPERITPALVNLGKISLEIGHLVEAEMWFQDAVSYCVVGNDKFALAEVRVLAAEVQWIQGHIQKAESLLASVLDSNGELRNYRQQAKLEAMVYSVWGRMYDQSGHTERAIEQYKKALNITKGIYDQEAEAELYSSLSSIFERVGNLRAAEEHLSKAMTIHYDLRLMELWADDNVRLARIAEVRGKPELRDSHLMQARQMYQQLGNKRKLEEFCASSE